MSEVFDLNAIVRDVCATDGDISVSEIVAEVDQAIPDEHRDEALRQALRPFVMTALTKIRRHAPIRFEDAPPAVNTQPAENVQTFETVRPITSTTNKQSARSWKVAGIRAHGKQWREKLDKERYSIEGGSGVTRLLGDLTRDDLLFNIRSREEHVRAVAAKTTEFRGLLDLVTRHNVDRVRELPEQALAGILDDAA